MHASLVSILICTYNAEKTIRWTLESVLAQTYQNIEVLVLDNDSKDKTWEILETYQTKDPRVKLFTVGENLGAYAGINYLLDQAKGEYIAIQDHDDVWTSEKIEQQIAFLQNHKEFVACGTGYLEYYSAHQTGFFITLPKKTNYARHTSLVFRKSSKRYETSNNYLCDFYFMKKILSDRKNKIANLPEIAVLHYNKKHLNNYSFQRAKFSWKNLKRAVNLHLISRFFIDLLPATLHSKVDRLIFSLRYGEKNYQEIKNEVQWKQLVEYLEKYSIKE